MTTRSRKQEVEEKNISNDGSFSGGSDEEQVSDKELGKAEKKNTMEMEEATNEREAAEAANAERAADEIEHEAVKQVCKFQNEGLSSDESEEEYVDNKLEELLRKEGGDYFKQRMIHMNKIIKKQAKEILRKGKMYENLKNKTSSSSSRSYGKKLDDGQKKFISTFTNLHVWQRIKLFEPDRITFDANKDLVDMMFRQMNITEKEDKEEIEGACFAFIKEKINQKRGNVKQSIEKDYIGMYNYY